MRRGPNPILIGAVTTIVVIVAVVLSYNANKGLPFVPTYNLKVELPNAANLVPGNEVRIGATRVGVIDAMTTRIDKKTGRVIAVASVKIEDRLRPLPADTSQLVRFKSALGLKYIELTRGTSKRGLKQGATIPISRASTPVEFDEAFAWADEKTRKAMQQQLTGFGDALAGRGDDLNAAIDGLGPMLTKLEPVARNLADPRTDLSRLITGLSALTSELAPVADEQGALIGNLDTTFSAIASSSLHLRLSIALLPYMEQTLIDELPGQRPFLRNTRRLLATMRPGIRTLAQNSDTLADAIELGGPALRDTRLVSRRLRPVMVELEQTATDPMVRLGVTDLSKIARITGPLAEFITPTQTVCNYFTLLFRNASSMVSVGDSIGTAQSLQLVLPPLGPNSEGGPAAAAANGGDPDNAGYLHANPYPNTAAPTQPQECEAGNETYIPGRRVVGNVPGTQSRSTEQTRSEIAPPASAATTKDGGR